MNPYHYFGTDIIAQSSQLENLEKELRMNSSPISFGNYNHSIGSYPQNNSFFWNGFPQQQSTGLKSEYFSQRDDLTKYNSVFNDPLNAQLNRPSFQVPSLMIRKKSLLPSVLSKSSESDLELFTSILEKGENNLDTRFDKSKDFKDYHMIDQEKNELWNIDFNGTKNLKLSENVNLNELARMLKQESNSLKIDTNKNNMINSHNSFSTLLNQSNELEIFDGKSSHSNSTCSTPSNTLPLPSNGSCPSIDKSHQGPTTFHSFPKTSSVNDMVSESPSVFLKKAFEKSLHIDSPTPTGTPIAEKTEKGIISPSHLRDSFKFSINDKLNLLGNEKQNGIQSSESSIKGSSMNNYSNTFSLTPTFLNSFSNNPANTIHSMSSNSYQSNINPSLSRMENLSKNQIGNVKNILKIQTSTVQKPIQANFQPNQIVSQNFNSSNGNIRNKLHSEDYIPISPSVLLCSPHGILPNTPLYQQNKIKKQNKLPPVCKMKTKKKTTGKGLWSEEEHVKFVEGLNKFGKSKWKEISEYIGTRSRSQVASHSQKFFKKLESMQE